MQEDKNSSYENTTTGGEEETNVSFATATATANTTAPKRSAIRELFNFIDFPCCVWFIILNEFCERYGILPAPKPIIILFY